MIEHHRIPEHQQLFPARHDGLAHRDDSLAIPERVRPSDAARNRDGQPGSDPELLLRAAERLIEFALATPGTDGDDAAFAKAQAHLDTAQAFGLYITNPVAMNGRIWHEYTPTLRDRAAHRWPSSGNLRIAQEGIGELLDLFLATSAECTPSEYCGRLSELVVHYGLLAGGRVITPVAHRQEANRYKHDNHDLDAFRPLPQDQQDTPGIVCGIVVPVSIKHVGPPDESPLVAMVRVGVIAQGAWRVALRRYGPTQDRRIQPVAATTALAETMLKHFRGKTLTDFELDFMARSIIGFGAVIDSFVPPRPEPLPPLAVA